MVIKNVIQITNPSDIANIFNDFFIDSTNTLNNKTKSSNNQFLTNSMFLRAMTEEEVKKEISSLNNTTSVGNDEIST